MLLVWWIFLAILCIFGLYKVGVNEAEKEWWYLFGKKKNALQLIGKGMTKVVEDISNVDVGVIMAKIKAIQRYMDRDKDIDKENKKEDRNYRNRDFCG